MILPAERVKINRKWKILEKEGRLHKKCKTNEIVKCLILNSWITFPFNEKVPMVKRWNDLEEKIAHILSTNYGILYGKRNNLVKKKIESYAKGFIRLTYNSNNVFKYNVVKKIVIYYIYMSISNSSVSNRNFNHDDL